MHTEFHLIQKLQVFVAEVDGAHSSVELVDAHRLHVDDSIADLFTSRSGPLNSRGLLFGGSERGVVLQRENILCPLKRNCLPPKR